ncbi:hypothetical protein NUW54_g14782 [Trametes sanguinea]|uniref:Uncharacterized protein n=1 Tax=Trametes sanguinea TaxID=158606 RepID=A0ACC1MAV8_9APHY|nr:hypothetical protein NUW54_g14782 [Trametes sanguinea]
MHSERIDKILYDPRLLYTILHDPPVKPGGNPAKSTWSCTARPATLYEMRSRRRTLAYANGCRMSAAMHGWQGKKTTHANGSEYAHLLRLYTTRVYIGTGDGRHLQLLRLDCEDNMSDFGLASVRPLACGALTFGTAAWKFRPLRGLVPVAVKCARILTSPGRVGEVCGVSVTRSSFLSYAVYPVAAGAAGAALGMGGEVA